jgi:hypothetical protein
MEAGGHGPNFKFRPCHDPAIDTHILVSVAPMSHLHQSVMSPILEKVVASFICNENKVVFF